MNRLLPFLFIALSPPALAAPDMDGGSLYHKFCSVCHGDKGDGRSRAQNSFVRPPRDFTKTPESVMPRQYMIDIVKNGKSGTAMVGWKTQLNEEQIAAVVDYVRIRFMGAGASETQPTPSASVDMSLPLPMKLTGNVAKGKALYLANCTPCHGEKGDGQGPRAYFINPKPKNFTTVVSRATYNRPALYFGIANGRPGSEMPAWNKVFTNQEIAHTAEYVFQTFIKGQETVK
jgi:mono/diheme cytochrome c family protein